MSNLKFSTESTLSDAANTRPIDHRNDPKHAAATHRVVDDDVVQTSPRANARTRDERDRERDGDD